MKSCCLNRNENFNITVKIKPVWQYFADVIENINLCKCFNIICDDPKPICDFIINGLNRSATVYHAEGAFTHHDKTVIMTTMKRSQALKLRNYIKRVEPTAFMLISNSSEIIGKGFLAN